MAGCARSARVVLPVSAWRFVRERSTVVRWHVGDVLKKLRSHMGWTLQQVAAAGGLDVNVIHRIETGFTRDPREDTLERLAVIYGLTLMELRVSVPQSRLTCAPDAETLKRADAQAFAGALKPIAVAKPAKRRKLKTAGRARA